MADGAPRLQRITDYPALLAEAWAQAHAPREANAPTVISTFAGCGGSSLGYHMAGFRELFAVEWEQNAADPKRYPFVTASGDLELRGRRVPYGARLYLEAYPGVVFRLLDTGSHFYGTTKVVRIPGTEPFDIATSYPGPRSSRLGISGTKTRYWVDFDDVTDYPAWLVVKRPAVA